jgi:hypothetical protein
MNTSVRVVGADEMHLVPLHALEAHPDVGLDVLHDVADVERPVRVRKGRRNKNPAFHTRWILPDKSLPAEWFSAILIGATRVIV